MLLFHLEGEKYPLSCIFQFSEFVFYFEPWVSNLVVVRHRFRIECGIPPVGFLCIREIGLGFAFYVPDSPFPLHFYLPRSRFLFVFFRLFVSRIPGFEFWIPNFIVFSGVCSEPAFGFYVIWYSL